MSNRQAIRSIVLPSLVLLATNIGAALLLLPTFAQLLLSTCSVVYIGCIMSTRLARDSNGEIINYSKSLEENESVISMK
jgi:hypothetical protein